MQGVRGWLSTGGGGRSMRVEPRRREGEIQRAREGDMERRVGI